MPGVRSEFPAPIGSAAGSLDPCAPRGIVGDDRVTGTGSGRVARPRRGDAQTAMISLAFSCQI
jgi:hypothetical protein